MITKEGNKTGSWNKVANNVPVSWDAIGGIVMSKGKRLFYYKLTIADIATRSVTTKSLSGHSFPVTSMLLTTHTTMDLVRWLQEFEAAHFSKSVKHLNITQRRKNVQVYAQDECRYSTALDQTLNETDLEADEIENSVSQQNATDAKRYGYRATKTIEHCDSHTNRTTGISESRLKVIKHTILRGEVSSRVDQVVKTLGSNIRQTEINYSNHYLFNLTRNRSVRAKKLLAEETWNKRAPSPTTTSIYSEKPKLSLVAQVKKALNSKTNTDK
ncbi:unnamed protein product [Rotaria sp. Silwood1]|nr:unnamed protein product [Rotaria sp. Silwood1]